MNPKTLVTLGLARAFSSRGVHVAPYKKGSTYFAAGCLRSAARAPGRNLDTFLMSREAIGAALDQVAGNRRKAAELLGIGERTLYRKISKYGLDA